MSYENSLNWDSLTYGCVYLVSLQAADHIEVCGVGDAAVHDKHAVVYDGPEWQPPVHAFDQLQKPLCIVLCNSRDR